MKYITHRRFKAKSISGEINLPAKTECVCIDSVITYEGKRICYIISENAHQYFAINEDGLGMERGRLTQAIQKKLAKRNAKYQERWDKIWEDSICQKYKRVDYEDYWLWNHDFFNAKIEDLKHIAKLLDIKDGD